MNEYEKFYSELDHEAWNEFKEELRYRLGRAQNEPMADEDWFVMCAMKELVTMAREAVAREKDLSKHCEDCEYFPGDNQKCLMREILVGKKTIACEDLNIPH